MAEVHPVLVVGAGPVGLAAALALRAQDLPVVVLEAAPEGRRRPGSRAIFLHRESLEHLEAMRPGLGWDVALFEEAESNAFALPGGKVGVNTGIFKVAKNQDQLAGVVDVQVPLRARWPPSCCSTRTSAGCRPCWPRAAGSSPTSSGWPTCS